ncbi:hypothetical protein BpHYR1_010507 [Brachionus plicatilis]|uniref:Uncharacterized protein n=1 Tax=Brachionus plicatilis TaxID=10195 RepID=A0A3M7SID7_BRAPC|nr:hypothetical protein BpHYR1_010507 [Brachionus plicatilis]
MYLFEQRFRPDTEVTASNWSSTPLLLPSRNRYPYFYDEREFLRSTSQGLCNFFKVPHENFAVMVTDRSYFIRPTNKLVRNFLYGSCTSLNRINFEILNKFQNSQCLSHKN